MIRAFQWDLARQVERLDVLKKLLRRYAAWGYQELYLHLEDAVHYPSLPGIGRTDAYTYEELGELVFTAARNGIRVVPIVNLLGHTQYLIKHPELRDLNELRDGSGSGLAMGQVCPLHPRFAEVAEKLIRDMAPYCTAGKMHVGLDESFHLGKCPRCREEVGRIGLAGHFAGHVRRLHQLVTSRNLQMGLWADMLYFIPEAIPQLPSGLIAYDWYYYPFARKPRVEFFNFAERDLHPALKKQGIAYYGCPMNGAFRYEPLPIFGDRLANIRSWWRRCQAVEAEGLLITSWEAYRLALETTTTVDAAAASLWLEPATDDATGMLAHGLQRVFSVRRANVMARQLLAADSFAFAGYARWQINDRWDVFAGDESLKPYEEALRFFRRLETEFYDWPAPFSASLSFRRYLAERDVYVRSAARSVVRIRKFLAKKRTEEAIELLRLLLKEASTFSQILTQGRRAAKAMWARTRNPGVRGQNELILESDSARLLRWRQWLAKAQRNLDLLWQTTPVAGAWQLQFVVHNFAPAVQKVIVEQQEASGEWKEIVSRYTIEFTSRAARPSAAIQRELTAPLDRRDLPLRIRIGGVGQVEIGNVALTNGVETLLPLKSRRRRKRLGQKAPDRGLPDLNPTGLRQSWVIRA